MPVLAVKGTHKGRMNIRWVIAAVFSLLTVVVGLLGLILRILDAIEDSGSGWRNSSAT